MTKRTAFVGRRREIQLLRDMWAAEKAQLLILYGRRRVGKTRLITHWMASAQPRALYWVAEPTSTLDQLRSFSQTIYNFSDPVEPAPETFHYASWRQAFQELARLSENERLAVFIDEFTYLLEIEPGIAGILQNLWDHLFVQSDLLLGLSGSHIGMMQRHVLSYQAPLYGRADAALKLQPLPYGVTTQFFPDYPAKDRVTLYGMLGGIPAYWERFDPKQSLDANIRQQFLTPNHLLQDEPRLLLQDFLTDSHNYVAILRAIAHGHRTPKEIANFTGLDAKHVPAYMSKLVETGFVERRLPVTAGPTSRMGRHHIVDPFLRFYYRFLSQRQRQLALGVQEQALAEIKRHLRDFIGRHTWEEVCREWLLYASARERVPLLSDKVGSLWNRDAQIDVVGVNSMEKSMVMGECKWSYRVAGRGVVRELVAKTSKVMPKRGRWKVYYLGFARSGWTPAAHAFAQEIQKRGENWEAVGAKLLGLEEVDRDLQGWSS